MASIEKILINSEDSIRTFFEQLPVPTYVWQHQDNDFVLFDYNKSAIEKKSRIDEIKLGIKCSEFFKLKSTFFCS